jgi:hypothetical protein
MKLTISNGIFESEISGIQEFSIENPEMLLYFKTNKAFLKACDVVQDLYESILDLNPDFKIPTLYVDEEDLIIYLDLTEVRIMYYS